MVGGNTSSEKIDLLVYGPTKKIINNGFLISSCFIPLKPRTILSV